MARRPASDPQPILLTREQIERGIKRLEKRREEVEKFNPEAVDPDNPSESTRPIETAIETALVETFGYDTPEFRRYGQARRLDYPVSYSEYVPARDVINALKSERTKVLQLLDAAIELLKDRLEDLPAVGSGERTQSPVPLDSRKVFIVHGHDDGMKEGVARFLSAIGFDPIILHEQPNKGRTIIHKFREETKDVGFAVVLLSPDDETTEGQRRARQNVILELGFFLGVLGPERVAALKKGDVETPSDFDGVIYTAFDGGGSWKVALSKELQAAGYSIDWNVVMA